MPCLGIPQKARGNLHEVLIFQRQVLAGPLIELTQDLPSSLFRLGQILLTRRPADIAPMALHPNAALPCGVFDIITPIKRDLLVCDGNLILRVRHIDHDKYCSILL
jgi:hypothetical protein